MALISLIAAMDEERGLGKNNQLLCHLPADLSHFKTITMGKPIIMGRKTFDSIGKPLPGRLNIVLSSAPKTQVGVEWVESLPQALALAGEAPEVMIIGGATLFHQSLALACRMYLTLIHGRFAADVFFPQIKPEDWHCSAMLEYLHDEKNAYDLSFYQYERRAKGSLKIK